MGFYDGRTVSGQLYFITDTTYASVDEMIERVDAAIRGGAAIVQLREKDRGTREYIEIATRVHEVTKKAGVPLIIDDRLDVALAMGAEGVHVGSSDMPVDDVRRIADKVAGKDFIVGATAKTVPAALDAFKKGADYLGCGAIYPTTTHVKTTITSTDTLRDICAAVPIPVYAIGGLNADNLEVLRGIPIAGVCVVSAIMKAPDPEGAARELISTISSL
ncbi:MAG: thiamine phosphate synthase [Lachnospiraceae bacterium]|nr:thiamine phosphate synthase [Lachnospiraceae bacterium]